MRAVSSGVADACCVAAFVAIGRLSHGEGDTLSGFARTFWPFLGGLAVGWLATRAWRRPAALVPAGLGAWLGTVAIGMVLRVISGQGTAVAFVVVAVGFLGLFMLGWRLVVGWFTPALPDRGSMSQNG